MRTFPLDQLLITPAAQEKLKSGRCPVRSDATRLPVTGAILILKIARKTNAHSLEGARLLSSYRDSDDELFWIITEADRRATTVLLPSDY